MNRMPLYLIFILAILNTQAQNVIDISAKEVYECTNLKMKSIDNPSDAQIDEFLTICTRDIYNNRIKTILRFYHLKVAENGTFEKFSMAVNDKMANPDAVTAIDDKDSKIVDEDIPPVLCTITAMYEGKFPTFNAKDSNGVEYSFVYIKPFQTDILYRYKRINPGDKFVISYQELDMYDEKTKDFITYKYMTQLVKKGYVITKEEAKPLILSTQTTSPTRKP